MMLLCCFLLVSLAPFVAAFSGRSSFVNSKSLPAIINARTSHRVLLCMRDGSASYWFSKGDKVEVVEDVLKAGVNLKGRVGNVVETWEKCDVDPTCCCAEQVDLGMAVRVQFVAESKDSDVFQHYFAEDELIKVKQEEAAFDGMSCTAFKLQQLNVGTTKPRGIASFDPTKQQEQPD